LVITLSVISNEPIPRSGLIHLLSSEPGFRVLGEGDERAAVEKAAALKPNVVLFHVPFLSSRLAETVSEVRRASSGAIVILGREIQAPYLSRALEAGATGFVLLRATPNHLFHAIRVAARQQRFIDPLLSDELLDYFAEKTDEKAPALSNRERQVLKMFAEGHTTNEIAEFLGIGRRAIETYSLRMRRKLRLRTRADLVRYALEIGLLR
jgi:DNA-binding NarL/FixJ family response regulator